ncbi:tetratricopeptide repeat protein [Myroides sp. LJL116]
MKKYSISIKTLLFVLPVFMFNSLVFAQEKVMFNPDDYVTNANREFNNGNWEKGKGILDIAVEESPRDSDIKMLLGKYYYHHKQYDKARYELVKALELKSDNNDAKQILLNVEIETQRYSSAICYVNELLETSPYLESLWQKKIHLYDIQGNHVEVNRLRKRLAQIYPNSQSVKDAYLYSIENQIVEDKKNGNIDRVIDQNKELLSNSPQNESYYLELINNYIKAGDYANALMYTNRGLIQFGNTTELVQKKIALLEQENRFEELLGFLKQNNLNAQYKHYLLEAARNAKNKDPFELYLKVLDGNYGNEEAFTYVFNTYMQRQQYDTALFYLNQFRGIQGNSKELLVKELDIYKKSGNTSKARALSNQLFMAYQQDEQLKMDYLQNQLELARASMQQMEYAKAIDYWYQVSQYGDYEMDILAQRGIYTALYELGDYTNALNTLDNLIYEFPQDNDLQFKKAQLYFEQGNYPRALAVYQNILQDKTHWQYPSYLDSYDQMLLQIVKTLNEDFAFEKSYNYVKLWLEQNPNSLQALKYGVNLGSQLGFSDQALVWNDRGMKLYPDDVFFKVKAVVQEDIYANTLEQKYAILLKDIQESPYHQELLNALEQVGQEYTIELLKQKNTALALEVIDQSLSYYPTSKPLNYTKGMVMEKLKDYDKARYYYSFYEPSFMDFKQHQLKINELEIKSMKNVVGIDYMSSRYNENIAKVAVTELHYMRIEDTNTYMGKLSYTGRDLGHGVQFSGHWNKAWTNRTSTLLDVGIANEFFPSFLLGATVFREINFWDSTELELGVGYRKFKENADVKLMDNHLFNLAIGANKQTDEFRLSVKLNNFFYDDSWLYNLSFGANYYLGSSKNFLTAVAGIGSAPEMENLDYSLYDGLSILNTNAGLGFGVLLYKNVSAKAMGTWSNFKAGDDVYKNLYNFYLSVNVAF